MIIRDDSTFINVTPRCRCSLFIVHGEGDSRVLVSDLFDVRSHSTVEEMNQKGEIRIPFGSGIVGAVAKSGQSLNIPDCYKVFAKSLVFLGRISSISTIG